MYGCPCPGSQAFDLLGLSASPKVIVTPLLYTSKAWLERDLLRWCPLGAVAFSQLWASRVPAAYHITGGLIHTTVYLLWHSSLRAL